MTLIKAIDSAISELINLEKTASEFEAAEWVRETVEEALKYCTFARDLTVKGNYLVASTNLSSARSLLKDTIDEGNQEAQDEYRTEEYNNDCSLALSELWCARSIANRLAKEGK